MTELILFWVTIFLYAAGFGFQAVGFGWNKPGAARWSLRLLWVGLVLHTATGIARWIAGDHAPVTNTWELNLTGTWFAMLVFLGFVSAKRVPSMIGLVVVPVIFLVLGDGFLAWDEAKPMGPAFQSPWLVVHVCFAWLAFGSYLIATGAAVFLLRGRSPDAERLDQMSYRFIVLGAINHVVMLISGAIWAKSLWGRYWSWDALETWSLLSFLMYAFYLHARAFLGWKMRRAAWIAACGLVVLSISFWGVEWFSPSTLHPGP